MFVGHYGVSFAAKKGAPSIPLWVLFIAVQLLDVVWAPFVLLGIGAQLPEGRSPPSCLRRFLALDSRFHCPSA